MFNTLLFSIKIKVIYKIIFIENTLKKFLIIMAENIW